jgi:hypothetical protein
MPGLVAADWHSGSNVEQAEPAAPPSRALAAFLVLAGPGLGSPPAGFDDRAPATARQVPCPADRGRLPPRAKQSDRQHQARLASPEIIRRR